MCGNPRKYFGEVTRQEKIAESPSKKIQLILLATPAQWNEVAFNIPSGLNCEASFTL